MTIEPKHSTWISVNYFSEI